MSIIINNDQEEIEVQESLEVSLVALADKILEFHGRGSAEVGIILADLATTHQLNLDYREINAPTDVLSFALEEGEQFVEIGEDKPPDLLGDVVICLPIAREQATEFGHSFTREVLYLAAHGLLHLLGYDHQSEEEQQRMRELEEKFLAEEGWSRL